MEHRAVSVPELSSYSGEISLQVSCHDGRCQMIL